MNSLSDKRILITGGTGHIGSHLVARLASEATYLLIVARNKQKLDELKRTNPSVNIEIFPCDLIQSQEVSSVTERVDTIDFVVHLAAAEIPKKSPVGDNAFVSVQSNVLATINVLNYFSQRVEKICLASATAVYGPSMQLPIHENHPVDPQTYYGAGKLAAEKYTSVFSQNKGCPAVILRFAHIYGPGEAAQRTIPNFIEATLKGSSPVIYGDGLDLRDYVYIDDAVEAIILALQKEKTTGCNVYNVASGQGYRIREVAELITKLCGVTRSPIYQPAKRRAADYVFDISAARKDLGYSPKTSLREGLQREIAWFKSGAKAKR